MFGFGHAGMHITYVDGLWKVGVSEVMQRHWLIDLVHLSDLMSNQVGCRKDVY